MAEYLVNAVIKGVVEGFTEFLPISSTAHLVLIDGYLPLTAHDEQVVALNTMFNIVVQFPAILAVLILFRKRLWESVRTIPSRAESRTMWLGLMLAFLPAAILGAKFKDVVEKKLHAPVPIAISLIVGGLVLLIIERAARTGSVSKAEDVPLRTAIGIGFFQCLALVPGTSRSGATIVGGRLCGLNRAAAAEFSFFLAIPTMFGAFTYKIVKDFNTIDWSAHWPVLLAGCVASFVTAWAVVALFMRLIEMRHSLAVWGWYRIVLGAVVLYYAQQASA